MSFEVDVSKRRGAVVIAERFTTGPGLTALFGPSGAGKTSILDMVAGTLRPDRGRIVVAGEVLFDNAAGIDVPPQRRRAGYVFQDGRLFPHLRVRANLQFGERLAAVHGLWMSFDEAVAFLDIAPLLERWPASLSGGEAQRVAIGRALLRGPRFLLMDEPLTGLDRARRDEVLAVIERLRDDLRIPILYVSHDVREVTRLATHRVDIGGPAA